MEVPGAVAHTGKRTRPCLKKRTRNFARLLDSLREARPILPVNAPRLEVELDHKLICAMLPSGLGATAGMWCWLRQVNDLAGTAPRFVSAAGAPHPEGFEARPASLALQWRR